MKRLRGLFTLLLAWLALLAEFLESLAKRSRLPRRWTIHLRPKGDAAALKDADLQRLLQRHSDLQDMQKLADFARSFHLPESDFFAQPDAVAKLMSDLLAANPPWLHVSKKLSGGDTGAENQGQQFLLREHIVREWQPVTLFIPDESWKDLPLASLTMRPIRNLEEVWQGRLLDQILPPEVLIDRSNRGEILIPVRHGRRLRLEFRTETRNMEIVVRKSVPVPIENEGDSGRGGQLLYVLLDYSASMRGKSAVLAAAAIAALLRANLGKGNTRYLFRRYALAEEIWPGWVEPPVQAQTLGEKDALLDTILATNFNGRATHVNDALNVAITDVENLRQAENLDAEILLVTDGIAEILAGTALRLRESRVVLHTVMVTPEPNPGLESVSESFTLLDIPTDPAASNSLHSAA